MEIPQCKMVREENLDMISNSPGDLKSKILVCLPIKEAVRASILSSKWRFAWASIPVLKLMEVSNSDNQIDAHSRFIKFVDMILLLHTGPILKFYLVSTIPCNEALDRWMIILSRNGIEELVIGSILGPECKISSLLFSCHGLKYLELLKCIIKPPPALKNFKIMNTLMLKDCTISEADLENLISSCPVLETLFLVRITGFIGLTIKAPKLRTSVIRGSYEHFILRTPSLVRAFISLDEMCVDSTLTEDEWNGYLVNSFGCISNIEELYIFQLSLLSLVGGTLPDKLPTPFNHLTELWIEIDIGDRKEAAVAHCLFQNSPRLFMVSDRKFLGIIFPNLSICES